MKDPSIYFLVMSEILVHYKGASVIILETILLNSCIAWHCMAEPIVILNATSPDFMHASSCMLQLYSLPACSAWHTPSHHMHYTTCKEPCKITDTWSPWSLVSLSLPT